MENAEILQRTKFGPPRSVGGTVLTGSPADFGTHGSFISSVWLMQQTGAIADETEKWAKVVKFSGARPD